MERDMDLIRELLLKLEMLDTRQVHLLDGEQAEIAVPAYTPAQIDYHLALIEQAGFLVPVDFKAMSGARTFSFSCSEHSAGMG